MSMHQSLRLKLDLRLNLLRRPLGLPSMNNRLGLDLGQSGYLSCEDKKQNNP
jgi:hypothetical protein